MALTRRQFLTLTGGSAAAAILFQACGVPADELIVQSPVEMPEDLVSGLDNWYATVCRQCASGEGVVVRVMEGRAKKIEGNIDYPTNQGKHSARCEAGLQALYHPDRIRGPLVRIGSRDEGRFEEISWTDAIGRLTLQLQALQESGRESSMVMATDPIGGHLGMVVERFVSRFGGRYLPYEALESTSERAAIKRVFRQDVMPDFDIENADYVLSFGADFLNTWGSPVRYARGYGNFRQGDRERGILTHAESRFSMTAANADRWLYVRPGMEGVLALSIAQVIISEGLGDGAAANALTDKMVFDLSLFAPEAVADSIGSSAKKVRDVAHEFAAHDRSLAIGGGSAGAHSNGLANLTAIYSLNYLAGNVGKPGGVIFNPKPALRDVPIAPSAASFASWQGLVADIKAGGVRVLMVRGADPVYGLPNRTGLEDALFPYRDSQGVPFIFSFSNMMDDTTALADLILPEHSYLEDWGTEVPERGPGYQTVGFQQPVVRPFFESRGVHLGTKGFADVLIATAQGLELDLGLAGDTFKDVVQDGAKQLFETNGGGSVKAASFAGFWNGVLQRGGWWDTSAGSTDRAPSPPALGPIDAPDFGTLDMEGFPFHLAPFASTSLGDGRGAMLPWLQATPDPLTTATWRTWVEINMKVAEEMGISEGDIVRVSSPHGTIEALAYPHPGAAPEVVSIPIGQGHKAGGRYAKGRGANVLSILSPTMDAQTGALAWAATRVSISKTDDWVRLPKFENTVPELPEDREQHVIKLTPIDT